MVSVQLVSTFPTSSLYRPWSEAWVLLKTSLCLAPLATVWIRSLGVTCLSLWYHLTEVMS